ncbi:MAG: hypothetical protein E6F99_07850 [Actinobacteria bacterium]|nr:MAG: hypothetical protein E6F99_07850 [Actinomycetota bacterium]
MTEPTRGVVGVPAPPAFSWLTPNWSAPCTSLNTRAPPDAPAPSTPAFCGCRSLISQSWYALPVPGSGSPCTTATPLFSDADSTTVTRPPARSPVRTTASGASRMEVTWAACACASRTR